MIHYPITLRLVLTLTNQWILFAFLGGLFTPSSPCTSLIPCRNGRVYPNPSCKRVSINTWTPSPLNLARLISPHLRNYFSTIIRVAITLSSVNDRLSVSIALSRANQSAVWRRSSLIDQTTSAVWSRWFPNTAPRNRLSSRPRWFTIVPPVPVLPQRYCIEHYSTWLKLTPLPARSDSSITGEVRTEPF